jgi:chromosomal replication initiation ATPase DnaA
VSHTGEGAVNVFDYCTISALKREGYTFDSLVNTIASLYTINSKDLLSKEGHKSHVEARDILCHVAVHDLGMSVTDLARRFNMAPSSISYAVMRGKKIAEEKHVVVVPKKIFNN